MQFIKSKSDAKKAMVIGTSDDDWEFLRRMWNTTVVRTYLGFYKFVTITKLNEDDDEVKKIKANFPNAVSYGFLSKADSINEEGLK